MDEHHRPRRDRHRRGLRHRARCGGWIRAGRCPCARRREAYRHIAGDRCAAPRIASFVADLHQEEAAEGSIVNVSSTFGHRPIAGAGHYAATKAALEQLTRSWALQLAPEHIRVNRVAPGPVETGILATSGLTAEVQEHVKQEERERVPLGRRGEPGEVVTWIVRLADPASTWLTGQVLTIDGGLELV
jgi:NAD(P)-dependent dehydrogenase (short-subunit alcohol dehydrogenase family)